jgi:hypothetical protein
VKNPPGGSNLQEGEHLPATIHPLLREIIADVRNAGKTFDTPV